MSPVRVFVTVLLAKGVEMAASRPEVWRVALADGMDVKAVDASPSAATIIAPGYPMAR
jgi:hypothetical protein